MVRNSDGGTNVLKEQGGSFTSPCHLWTGPELHTPREAQEPPKSHIPPRRQNRRTCRWWSVHQRRRVGTDPRSGRKRYAERSDWFRLVALPRRPWGGRPAPPRAPTRCSTMSSKGARRRKNDLSSGGGFSWNPERVAPEQKGIPFPSLGIGVGCAITLWGNEPRRKGLVAPPF